MSARAWRVLVFIWHNSCKKVVTHPAIKVDLDMHQVIVLPWVGLWPKMPQKKEGILMLPAMSEPIPMTAPAPARILPSPPDVNKGQHIEHFTQGETQPNQWKWIQKLKQTRAPSCYPVQVVGVPGYAVQMVVGLKPHTELRDVGDPQRDGACSFQKGHWWCVHCGQDSLSGEYTCRVGHA